MICLILTPLFLICAWARDDVISSTLHASSSPISSSLILTQIIFNSSSFSSSSSSSSNNNNDSGLDPFSQLQRRLPSSSLSSSSLLSLSTEEKPTVRTGGQLHRKTSSYPSGLENVNKLFSKVIDPVAIVTGIVGNALLALVFLITPLRARPLSHVLGGVGVVDLLYTLSTGCVYLSSKGVRVYDVPGMCQTNNFVLMVTRSLQAWYILLAHVDRVSVHFSSSGEKRRRRVFHMKFILIFLVLLISAPFLHVLWSFETLTLNGVTYCMPMRDTITFHLTLRKIELIAGVFLPLSLAALIDMLFGLKLCLYIICRTDDDDEDEAEEDSGSNYNGKDIKGFSSFGEDKIIQMPLQERRHVPNDEHELKSISCENVAAMGKVSAYECSSSQTLGNFQQLNVSVSCHEIGDSKKLAVEGPVPIGQLQLELATPSVSPNPSQFSMNSLIKGEDCFGALRLGRKGDSKRDVSEKVSRHCEFAITKPLSSEYESTAHLTHAKSAKAKIKKSKIVLKRNFLSISQSQLTHSQWQSYNYNSVQSNTSRNQPPPEDHMFSTNSAANTVVTCLLGFALAALLLPSACSQLSHLFLQSPSARPSPHLFQKAKFFEHLASLNAVYKFFLYIVGVGSFRQAIVWLLTQWVPAKVTRMSGICLLRDRREIVAVYV